MPREKNLGIPATFDALKKEGVPSSVAISFAQTVSDNDCILMTRVPGGVCNTLINEGHDLKGFHVKAKSCNWGPMAGFICKLPPFNKKGMGDFISNCKEHVKYLQYLDVHPDLIPQETPSIGPFYPLSISAARKKELFDNKAGFQIESIESIDAVVKDSLFYGVAHNNLLDLNKRTVTIEFLLVKTNIATVDENSRWYVLHGGIILKIGSEEKFYSSAIASEFIGNSIEGTNEKIAKVIDIANIEDEKLSQNRSGPKRDEKLFDSIMAKRNDKFKEHNALFAPVQGVINPDFPFKQPNDPFHLNTISGDYDLFAAWPLKYVPNELVRESEKRFPSTIAAIENSEEKKNARLMTSCNYRKCFTTILENNNVHIEFIPTIKELNDGKLEHEHLGNINKLVTDCVNSLNTKASSVYNGIIEKDYNFKANKAFHSDEGGRPGVIDIEWPIAAFIPEKAPFFKYKPQDLSGDKIDDHLKDLNALLISNELEFLCLMKFCLSKNAHVILNVGWLIHLMTLTYPNLASLQEDFPNDGKVKELYEKITQKISDLPATANKIKAMLSQMLYPNKEPNKQLKSLEAYRRVCLKFISSTDPRLLSVVNRILDFVAAEG